MTQSQERDYELSLAALRGEEPAGVDKARLKEKLIKRGVALAATASAVPASAAVSKSALSLAAKLASVAVLATGLAVTFQASRTPEAHPPLHATETHALAVRPAPAVGVQPPQRPRAVPAATQRPRAPARDLGLDLARENALLSQAAAALKAADLRAARALLDNHEREFPQGFLRAEREKARRRLAELSGP